MALVRWNPGFSPARDLMNMHDEMNRLFDSLVQGTNLAPNGGVFTPAIDIEETPEGFILRADLPGVSQKDVRVSLMGDTLTIRGERRLQADHKDGNFRRTERAYGVFERVFTLGTPVRNDAVKAHYRDGVLEIHVPKAEEARLREIEVQVGQ